MFPVSLLLLVLLLLFFERSLALTSLRREGWPWVSNPLTSVSSWKFRQEPPHMVYWDGTWGCVHASKDHQISNIPNPLPVLWVNNPQVFQDWKKKNQLCDSCRMNLQIHKCGHTPLKTPGSMLEGFWCLEILVVVHSQGWYKLSICEENKQTIMHQSLSLLHTHFVSHHSGRPDGGSKIN